MVITYDQRPNATVDEKMRSLIESIMLALNEKNGGGSGTVINQIISGGGLSWAQILANLADLPEASSIDPTDLVLINQDDIIKQIQASALGGGSGDKNFTYTQSLPSATWVIQHDLGKNPDVTVIDSSGAEVIGDVEYTSLNSLTLTFSGAFGGIAYLN